MQNFNILASVCSWADRFESYLIGEPENSNVARPI